MKTTNKFKQRQAIKKIMRIILAAVILMSASFETVLAGVNAAADMVDNVLDDASSNSTLEQSDQLAGLAYKHENYEIIYTVQSEWQNHQTIEMTLKNIGETSIKN